MAGDLRRFVDLAMGYCWDESHGYSQSSDGMGHPGFDCSGLIGRCLYEAGFNYPSYHVGTANMVANNMTSTDALGDAGFIEIPVTSYDYSIVKPGDIIVMNHLNWSGGHAFIYMENVYAYNSTLSGYSSNYPNTKSICTKAKIEAADVRSWNSSLRDDPNPNTGACTEVFVHNFDWNYFYGGYNPYSSGDQIVIARWPKGFKDDLFLLKRIRDGQFNLDDWTNKFMSDGI